TFSPSTQLVVGGNPRSVALVELNADGLLDIVALNAGNNTVSVLLGTVGGGFAGPVNFATGGSDPYHIMLADLNADGQLDLVVANYGSSQVGVLVGNGDGSFQAVVNYGAGNTIAVAVGDWDEDGRADLAGAYYSGNSVTLLFGSGPQPLAEDPVGSGLRSAVGRGNLTSPSDRDYWSFSGQAG